MEWLRLKAEYKELQRQSIQNLKAQLQQSQTNGSVTQEDNKESLETKKSVAEEVKSPIAKLPYTPGVVLKFKSMSKDLIARDVRVRHSHTSSSNNNNYNIFKKWSMVSMRPSIEIWMHTECLELERIVMKSMRQSQAFLLILEYSLNFTSVSIT